MTLEDYNLHHELLSTAPVSMLVYALGYGPDEWAGGDERYLLAQTYLAPVC